MRRAIVVVQNFYEDPLAIRSYALRQTYCRPYERDADVVAGRARVSWMTSWFKAACDCPFKSSELLIGRLEVATGERINLEHWNGWFPLTSEGKADYSRLSQATTCLWNCSFHVKPLTGQQLGQGVHNHVTDTWNSVGPDGWAGLIYLNPEAPLSGGLKIWKNCDEKRNYDWMTPKENWELIDDLGNVFNRLILCRGDLPHSGARGWGERLENGRLYQTFFFKTMGTATFPSVTIPTF